MKLDDGGVVAVVVSIIGDGSEGKTRVLTGLPSGSLDLYRYFGRRSLVHGRDSAL